MGISAMTTSVCCAERRTYSVSTRKGPVTPVVPASRSVEAPRNAWAIWLAAALRSCLSSRSSRSCEAS